MRRLVTVVALTLAITACRASPETVVIAERYDSFWLWAGVAPQPVLKAARSLYILEGEVTAGEPARLTALRPGTPRLGRQDIWLVVRVETLRWSPAIYASLLARLARWRAAGNSVVGLQIDFDARTKQLDSYAAFLGDLRRRLRRDCKLSVTGLLDWSANGDPAKLAALGSVVDEVVLQTYQGRQTIPGYAAWLRKLDQLAIPFRIGIVQGGLWSEPPGLRSNPNFRGYVVFLLDPEDRSDRGKKLRH